MSNAPSPAPPPPSEQSARDQSDSLNAAIATGLGILKAFVCPKCGGMFGGAVDGTDPEGMWECHSDGCRSTKRRLGLVPWTGPWSSVQPPAFDVDGDAMLELMDAIGERRWGATIEWFATDSGQRCGVTVYAPLTVGHAVSSDPRIALRDAAARALGLAAGKAGAA